MPQLESLEITPKILSLIARSDEFNLEKAVGCCRVCRARCVQQGGTTRLGGSGWAQRLHSVVSQGVIAIVAQKLNVHAV
jgi:hypothetical protein